MSRPMRPDNLKLQNAEGVVLGTNSNRSPRPTRYRYLPIANVAEHPFFSLLHVNRAEHP